MSVDNTITLGTARIDVRPVPLGRIKKILAAVHRANLAVAAGVLDDAAVDDLITVLAEGTGKTAAELEGMPCTLQDLTKAYETVLRVIGLEEMMASAKRLLHGGDAPGESAPVQAPASTHLTSSTAPSQPTSVGDGTTSTSA